jgi:hypothetical protein
VDELVREKEKLLFTLKSYVLQDALVQS